MPKHAKLEITSDFAYSLATDDGFRAELEKNPRKVFANYKVQLAPEQVPANVTLPSKQVCMEKFGLAPQAPGQKAETRKPAPKRSPAKPSPGQPGALKPAVKRQHFCFFFLRDKYFLEIEPLLDGEISILRANEFVAIDLLTHAERIITPQEFEILYSVPSTRWIPVEALADRTQAEPEAIDALIEKGLLLGNGNDKWASDMRQRDAHIASTRWEPYAALYHFMAKWQDVGMQSDDKDRWEGFLDGGEIFRKHIAQYGMPPDPFYVIENAKDTIELPLKKDSRVEARIGSDRKTTRVFDRDRPMSFNDFSSILRYVYGCQGTAQLAEGVTALKKTSPSGGGLHPVEVYPLVLRVKNLEPGIYHYNVRDHALELIEEVTVAQAEALANEFTAGQSYFQTAGALFIMAARFYRNSWKYQTHKKAYKVLLMDAAHLSQTFYLTCAALGLGAFFTAAINEANIEEKLKLNGFEQGPLGICGCGELLEDGSDLTLQIKPYKPAKRSR